MWTSAAATITFSADADAAGHRLLLMRTVLVILAVLVFTPFYASVILVAALFRVRPGERSIYAWAPREWSRRICAAAGAKVITHGFERFRDPAPVVLLANHGSWFDVFALCSTLPRYAFVAKAELGEIPLFGRASRIVGQIFIERSNRKAAFAEYEKAAVRIREGTTVVIFPEGSRGTEPTVRPFKKGPFVLAIASGVPIVPILIHGSYDVHHKGSKRIRSHDIHLHALDEVPTAGLTYDDRDALARRVHERLRVAQRTLYGLESAPW
jgi:1-acyl-sn-glycerol-3-phosphate acyltransferase